MPQKPTAIDLFCGCGGLTQGLKEAGFKVLGAVEINALAVETYKANHPEVEVWDEDIQEISVGGIKKELRLKSGELTLLAGCPPCQGFSTMRTLNGKVPVQDAQNDLIFEFLRFVEELKPKFIMLENVPGLEKDQRFSNFQEHLKEMGYLGESKVLNAANYGVPQRRRRLIYLAGLRQSVPFAPEAETQMTVRDAIGGLPKAGASGDSVHDFASRHSARVMSIIQNIPPDGGNRSELPDDLILKCHTKLKGFFDVYGRISWDKPAPTITGGCFNPSKGRFLHPSEHRAITMREAALLQGFPLDYYFPSKAGKTAVALMVGNALPPPFIAAHAKSIFNMCRLAR